MITGVRTGGHITGCAAILKQHYPNKSICSRPEASPVISGGDPAPHLYRNWRWIYTCKPAHRFT
jgi:cysteine synthase A